MSEHFLEPVVVDEDVFTCLTAPSLEDVRRDADEAPNVRRHVQPMVEGDFVTPFVEAPPGRRVQDLLPHLYAYSTRARCDDIPDDLVGECVWALEVQMGCWRKDPNDSLQPITPVTVRLDELSTRLDAQRPDRAVEPTNRLLAWLRGMKDSNPLFNVEYAIMLAKLAVNDDEAERILTRFLASDDEEAFSRCPRIRVQLYLARVFRRKGRLQEADVMETELVRWFKRNPHLFSDSALKGLWVSDDGEVQTDPVLTALGGSSWLDHRKRTIKTEERRAKSCMHCNNDDLRVALKICGACKDVSYCSSGCQKADWPFHKELCKLVVNLRQNSRMIGPEGEPSNDLPSELRAWATMYMKNDHHTEIHALGLHRDPTRGRTHIFITEVEHDPSAVTISKRFALISCGVFRIDDILGTIEESLELGKGEGREVFRKFLLRLETGSMSDCVPAFQLVTCWNKADSLSCAGVPPETLEQVPYNPDWMQTISCRGKQAPKTIVRWHNARNAEHDF